MSTTPLVIRQRIRKAILILVFLSFPITMNYLSPYVIIDGAMNGIINGSLVMFGLMFLSFAFPRAGLVRLGLPGGGDPGDGGAGQSKACESQENRLDQVAGVDPVDLHHSFPGDQGRRIPYLLISSTTPRVEYR